MSAKGSSCQQPQSQREGCVQRAQSMTYGAVRQTKLVEELARSLLSRQPPDDGHDASATAFQIQGAIRLCVRILTSHVGESLILRDDASLSQMIRTRLVKAS